jgi:ubiquinone/menaquinone biosynthesis C-methylase UbiE
MGSSVLECGCGGGYFFKRLIEKKPDIQYQGIDLSEKQIEHAKKVNPEYQNRFQVSSWDKLPFEDESFDTILFLETMGYAENVDKMISECYRVLKPGGTVFNKHPGSSLPSSVKKDGVSSFVTTNLSLESGAYDLESGDRFIKPQFTTITSNLFEAEKEYGYSEKSLGMFMNFPSVIRKFKKHNFSVPDGVMVPNIDTTFHTKNFFIPEVHEYLENFKNYDHTIAPRFIDGDSEKFWSNVGKKMNNPGVQIYDILSSFGKKHRYLSEIIMKMTFTATSMREKSDLMSPCMIFTAIKD